MRVVAFVLVFGVLQAQAAEWRVFTADLTAYCPCVECCGDFPGKIRGQTASGRMAEAARTVAAPSSIPFGSLVVTELVPGELSVLGVVEDRGGAIEELGRGRIKLDLYFDSHEDARKFGVHRGVTVYVRMEGVL